MKKISLYKRIIIISWLFWGIIVSCQNNKIIDPILSKSNTVINYDDTTFLNLAGYYHNLILDSLIQFQSTIPDSILDSLISDKYWIYQNLFLKSYQVISGFMEFQEVEIDTGGGYNFVVNFIDLLTDTTENFEVGLEAFLQMYCQNDTLVNLTKTLLILCGKEDYQTRIDSLLNVVTTSGYSSYIKNVIRIGVSIAKGSIDYWRNYYSVGIVYKRKGVGNKILAAQIAAYAAVDLLGGIGTAAISYIGGERNGWKLLGEAVIGGAVTSACAFLPSAKGVEFLGKIGKWFQR